MAITSVTGFVSQLTLNDLVEILEQSGYPGFSINTSRYTGQGHNNEYAGVFACTADDDSGVEEDGVIYFNIYLTTTKNGELRAEF